MKTRPRARPVHTEGMGPEGGRSAADVLVAAGISKRYGPVRALEPVSISVRAGELVAVIGHNGAGKSTLIKILSGQTRSDSGRLTIRGFDVPASYSQSNAHLLGVRVVDQEVTLCGNLTVTENFLIAHRGLGSLSWHARVEATCRRSLEAVFPGSGVEPRAEVNRLPMAQRQMAAIAFATYTASTETPLALLILDEPTSSLDLARRNQLFAHLAGLRSSGASVLLISHRLDEVLANSDRVVVLRDGRVAGAVPTEELSRESLIDLMGQAEGGGQEQALGKPGPASVERVPVQSSRSGPSSPPLAELADYSDSALHQISMSVRGGEIVGLGGLEGNGQRELLNALYSGARRHRARHGMKVTSHTAYVSGDRNSRGVFHLWSVEKNLSIASLPALLRWGMVQRYAEAKLADRWIRDLNVRVPHRESVITSLSGGSQQKVLIGRVLASAAMLILLDDPTRGVDVGTKREIYSLLHAAAREGTSFLWYSTENEELKECDRILVMREGRLVRELAGGAIEERVLVEASFADNTTAGTHANA